MNNTVDGIEKTVAQTYRWLNEIMHQMPTQDRREAYHALRAVLMALRDRLPVEEVSDLAAQMPILVRGLFFDGWDPRPSPRIRTREEFYARVADQLPIEYGMNVMAASRAVIHTLRSNISSDEMDQVRGVLPTALKEIIGSPPA